MCGITGIIKLGNVNFSLAKEISKMNYTIRHRGPDGEGFVLFNSKDEPFSYGSKETLPEIYHSTLPYKPTQNINLVNEDYFMAFGHRRLSIIDLSPAGHQPMCLADKKLWITYNGELYNYIELRNELKLKGYVFFTQTDTEVILNAYKAWGRECLNKFNGMWAFAIYDSTKNELFCARDRFGVKPFYYYQDKHVFAFASEQKALVKSSFVTSEINSNAVFDFFMKGEMEYEEEGMFKNIFELFPSHAFILNTKTQQFNKWRYYKPAINTAFELFDTEIFNQHVATTKQLLINAIDLRLRSDVTVGACLSGGIDSSSIVGITNYLLKQQGTENVNKLKVFTACFNDPVDESKWAEKVVNHTQTEWYKNYTHSGELLRDLDELIYSQDVPIWSTSTYAQHRLMKLVKETGIKVVLDGQGSDELFGGYTTHNLQLWLDLLKNKQLKSFNKEINSFDHFPGNWQFFIKQFLRYNGIKKFPVYLQTAFSKAYYNDLHYLNSDFWQQHKNRTGNTTKTVGSLNELLFEEFYNTRLKIYLKCEDRCAMWHSVESRTPFADDKALIEYGFSIPGTYKIHNSNNKNVLKAAVKPFIPEEVLNRKDKKGYTTPNTKWVTEIKDQVYNLFDGGTIDNYIDTKKLKKDYHTFFDLTGHPDTGRIFKFISFAKWLQVFNK